MVKDEKPDFGGDWYDFWMKQSREFFESAESNLKGMYTKNGFANPEEHLKQVNQWMDMLKKQWQFNQFTDEQKIYESYWKMMAKIFNDSYDMMLEQWIKRTNQQNPIKDVRELYEVWLNCCHETYQKSLQNKTYENTYGDMMNAAINFWKSSIPK